MAHNARFDYSFLRDRISPAGRALLAPRSCAPSNFAAAVSRAPAAQSGCRDGAARLTCARGTGRWAMRACSATSGSSCAARCRRKSWRRRRRPCSVPTGCRRTCRRIGRRIAGRPGCLSASSATETCSCTSAEPFLADAHPGSLCRPSTPSPSSRAEAQRDVRRIDWVETAGDLGAHAQEAEWIKTQQPLLNRRLKPKSDGFTLQDLRSTRPRRQTHAPSPTCEPAELAELLRRVSFREGWPQGADRHRPRAACFVPEGPGSRVPRRGLVLRATRSASARAPASAKNRSSCTTCACRWPLSALKLKPWPFPGRVAMRERRRRRRRIARARSLELLGHRALGE